MHYCIFFTCIAGVQVAFYVRKIGTQTTSPSTVVFEEVVTNLGGFWNIVTHTFVVPVKGFHSFSFIYKLNYLVIT